MVFSCFCLALPNINDIKNLNICYIAMRYPKMSQPETDVLVVLPTEAPNDMANEVVNENTPQPHKRDAATKEKVLKLLKLENATTASGSDTGPTTPTNSSTPEPGTPRPTYDT